MGGGRHAGFDSQRRSSTNSFTYLNSEPIAIVANVSTKFFKHVKMSPLIFFFLPIFVIIASD